MKISLRNERLAGYLMPLIEASAGRPVAVARPEVVGGRIVARCVHRCGRYNAADWTSGVDAAPWAEERSDQSAGTMSMDRGLNENFIISHIPSGLMTVADGTAATRVDGH